MSVRVGKTLSLTGISGISGISGIDYSNKTNKEFQEIFGKVLNAGMHGLCFSPYEEGQKPGDILSEEQIRR